MDSVEYIQKQLSLMLVAKRDIKLIYIRAKELYLETLEQVYNLSYNGKLSESQFLIRIEFVNKVLYRRYLHYFSKYLKICNDINILEQKLNFYKYNE